MRRQNTVSRLGDDGFAFRGCGECSGCAQVGDFLVGSGSSRDCMHSLADGGDAGGLRMRREEEAVGRVYCLRRPQGELVRFV